MSIRTRLLALRQAEQTTELKRVVAFADPPPALKARVLGREAAPDAFRAATGAKPSNVTDLIDLAFEALQSVVLVETRDGEGDRERRFLFHYGEEVRELAGSLVSRRAESVAEALRSRGQSVLEPK